MNLSFSEIFIILVIGILFLKPGDIPVIAKALKSAFYKIIALKNDILNEFKSVEDEFSEIEHDLKQNNKIIPDEKSK